MEGRKNGSRVFSLFKLNRRDVVLTPPRNGNDQNNRVSLNPLPIRFNRRVKRIQWSSCCNVFVYNVYSRMDSCFIRIFAGIEKRNCDLNIYIYIHLYTTKNNHKPRIIAKNHDYPTNRNSIKKEKRE